MNCRLPYGQKELEFDLDDEVQVQEIRANKSKAVPNIEVSIRTALANPIGAPPLAELVRSGEKVVIVISDITRLWVRTDLILPVLLNVLNELGIPDQDISLVVAAGDHRPLTQEEHILICGENIVQRVEIFDHDCQADDLVDLGVTSRGTRIKVNRRVWDADKVILTGGIAYHLLAGFGGGRKSLAPGVCGYETIQQNHGLALRGGDTTGVNTLVGIGRIAGNPVAEDMLEIARKIGADFILNVVVNEHKEIVYIAAGELEKAHLAGCRVVEDLYGIPVSGEADLVIASCGGYPKDIQLYQAIKALDNSAYAVKAGGVIILLSECSDGVGSKPFYEFFAHGGVEELNAALHADFSMPGFVALRTAGICRRTSVILISSLPDETVRQVNMIPAHSPQEALDKGRQLLDGRLERIYLMPHGSSTFPVITA